MANQITVWSHDQLFASSLIPCRSSDSWSVCECWLGNASCRCLRLGIWNQFWIHGPELLRSNDPLLCLCIGEGACLPEVMEVPHPLVTSQVCDPIYIPCPSENAKLYKAFLPVSTHCSTPTLGHRSHLNEFYWETLLVINVITFFPSYTSVD